jgi:hypothetical protein
MRQSRISNASSGSQSSSSNTNTSVRSDSPTPDEWAGQSSDQGAEASVPTIAPFSDVAPAMPSIYMQVPWATDAYQPPVSAMLAETEEQFSEFRGIPPDTNYVAPAWTIDLAQPNLPVIGPFPPLNDAATPLPFLTSFGSNCSLSFPDSYLLPVLELSLLRALLKISKSFDCRTRVLDPNALSAFNDPTAIRPRPLPQNWAPTIIQSTVPHHALLDTLPWPAARDRIITLFSLPEDTRPPEATGPLGPLQLLWDMEDSAEGMRISEGHICDPTKWEVGQRMFERWWFIFDEQIIDQSNRWRSARGAEPLRLNSSGNRVEDIGIWEE